MRLRKEIVEVLNIAREHGPMIQEYREQFEAMRRAGMFEHIEAIRRAGIFEDEETKEVKEIPSVAEPINKKQRDYKLKSCKIICDNLGLKAGETVSRETKFEIAKKLDLDVGEFNNFKSGKSNSYQETSKMVAELGYKKRGATKYN
ncbi:MAG: hypothetical protein Q8K98_00845 [Bacteroidota bacterium]|nr:hypothetical protein [Bacteroidota bacterium]